ncbi:BURP domain-containing protein 5 [Spatholobus suberectus]|nr:BURP domain-containing protein 5 [Spatholobus suberectus]
MIPVANHHQHDHLKADLVFFEEEFRPGMKVDVHFPKRRYATPLLPCQIAQRIPFSSEKIKEIFDMFFVKPKSKNVEVVEKAISEYEALLILMTAHAALPPEVYWERMLPNIPMPKAIKGLLNLESQFPFTKYGEKRTLSQDDQFPVYGAMDSQSHNDANALPPKMILVTNHRQHDHPKAYLIFFEEGLRPGTKLDAHFNKRKYASPLLPRQNAQRIPFSSKKINEILDMLFVKPKSKNVEVVEKAISQCEAPVINGEEKHCATSLESMVDFVTSKLGKNVHVISTEAEKETKSQKFSVKDGVKMLAEDKVIACHPMNYPYVVFYYLEILNTTGHFMPLREKMGLELKL